MAIEHFQFGDIILTRNSSLNGRVNAAYQKFRRNRYLTDKVASYAFIPTHAAFVLSNTEVIHSTKRSSQPKNPRKAGPLNHHFIQFFRHVYKNGLGHALRQVEHREILNLTRLLLGQGVAIDTAFLQTLVPEDTFVIRHPMLANLDLSTMLKMRQAAFYHLGKPYNTLIEASDGKGVTAFCSQLIYTIFNDAGFEMPSQQAHQVLPLDFLIWAITNNWQIITHEQVRPLLLQRERYLEVSSPVNSRAAELHDAVVEDIQEKQNLIQIFRQIDQTVVDLVQRNKGVVLPPRVYKTSGIKPEPISVEQIILAGDNVYRYLTGREPRDVNTPSEAEDKASVFSVLDIQEVKKLSWFLDAEPSVDNKTAALDPDLIIHKHAIKTAEVILADFDLALKEVIAHINTQPDASVSVSLQQNDTTSDIHESLELLWLIAGFFMRDKEDSESHLVSVAEKLKVMSGQVVDEFKRWNTESEANAQESGRLSQASKAFLAMAARCHAYGCAFDFLSICRGLVELDKVLADSSLTLSDLYEHDPQAFLKFMTTMNTPRRVRYSTHIYIDNLPLPIKQYWDNM